MEVHERGQEPVSADAEAPAESTSRRGFVKRLAGLAAVGIGVGLIPARAAKAAGAWCCYNESCGPCTNSVPFRCQDRCVSQFCCACFVHDSSCFLTNCVC